MFLSTADDARLIAKFNVETAASASNQVDDFACVSQLQKVHDPSRRDLKSCRRSLWVSPGIVVAQTWFIQALKSAFFGTSAVDVHGSLRSTSKR
jgi:hypothetical protein